MQRLPAPRSQVKNTSMHKTTILFTLLLTLAASGCKKGGASAENPDPSIYGKWFLIASLSDPGDGSGQWQAVQTPHDNYITFKTDSTIETNYSTGLAQRFTLTGNSIIHFVVAPGDTVNNSYHIDHNILTLMGGCIEACGQKFVRDGD